MRSSSLMKRDCSEGVEAASQALTWVAIFYLARVKVGASVAEGVLRSTQWPQFSQLIKIATISFWVIVSLIYLIPAYCQGSSMAFAKIMFLPVI
jgi:hypothetical protein